VHLVSYIGRGLDRSEEDIPRETARRLMDMWEWLVARLEPGEHPERRGVFEPFGWWFGAGALDDAWELAHLERIITLGVAVDPDFRVLPRLLELLPIDQVGVLRTLRLYLGAAGRSWRVVPKVRAILLAAVGSSDPLAANEIQHIANLMVDRGLIDFREFTEPPGFP
jgi:hypothetical protein